MNEKFDMLKEKIRNMNKSYYFLILLILIFFIIVGINGCSKKDNDIEDNSVSLNLTGESVVKVAKNGIYDELGVIAKDSNGNDVSNLITQDNGDLDTSVPGEYTITYSIEVDGKTKSITRKVIVLTNTITDDFYLSLEGNTFITIEKGTAFKEPGYSAYDKIDKEITNKVIVNNEINFDQVGLYNISYSIKNTSGKSITKYRLIKVVEHKTLLVIAGGSPYYVAKGTNYIDPGYYAYDTIDGNITNNVSYSGDVNNDVLGNYLIKYSVTNSRGLVTTANREVIVINNTNSIGKLEFNLIGNQTITLNHNDNYIEPGYSAIDSIDGNINSKVKIDGNVNTNKSGIYVLTYSVTNSTGVIKSLIRIITVKEENIEPLSINLVADITNYANNVVITANAVGSNFSYILLPDGTKTSTKNAEFKATENGDYTFHAIDKDNNQITKTITINNIDKTPPVGGCILDGYGIATVITKDSESGIKGIIYSDGTSSSELTNKTTYDFKNFIQEASIKIYDNANNEKALTCKFDNTLEIHFINVGRNEAIFIRTLDNSILIDTGTTSNGTTVYNYIKKLGVTEIDAIIGSHLHYNHVQGQSVIINKMSVKSAYYDTDIFNCSKNKYCLYSGSKGIKNTIEALKNKNIPTSILSVGKTIKIGDISIKNYAPITRNSYSNSLYPENKNSLNFTLTFGKNKFFFTGDHFACSEISKKFGKDEFKNIDLFKAAHHGEGGEITSCPSLLATMNPSIVVVSSDDAAALSSSERKVFKNSNVKFYITAISKNVLVTSDGTNLKTYTKVDASDYNRNVD